VCESQTLIDDPVDFRGEKTMEFHLVYAGDLLKPASGGKHGGRVWEKHAIRKYFHPQMRKLWETHPALRYYGDKIIEIDHNDVRLNPPQPFLTVLARNYEKSGTGFIPLMTEANGLACALDILFLRPDQPGSIVDHAGDLDNRVKVLIDALQIPPSGSEIVSKSGEEDNPNPMYCLLQDDKLITSLRVKTDRLLFSAGDTFREACLIIRVETLNIDPFGSPWELHL
jgi:hypothetical protein